MKHLRKTEQKGTKTPPYLYILGALMKLTELIKIGCKGILRHFTEALMAIAFAAIIIAGQAFDSGAINYTTAILFITILAVILVALIKVKILEKKGKIRWKIKSEN